MMCFTALQQPPPLPQTGLLLNMQENGDLAPREKGKDRQGSGMAADNGTPSFKEAWGCFPGQGKNCIIRGKHDGLWGRPK